MKVTIKNIEDITIKQYKEILLFLKESESFERDIKIIAYLSDISIEELRKFDYEGVQKLFETVNQILSKEINSDDKIDEVTINEKKYIFDNLDKISTGMFCDLLTFTKDNNNDNLHIICAILYREKIRGKINNYDNETKETLMKRAKIFDENMSITTAENAGFFLMNLKLILLKHMKESLGNY